VAIVADEVVAMASGFAFLSALGKSQRSQKGKKGTHRTRLHPLQALPAPCGGLDNAHTVHVPIMGMMCSTVGAVLESGCVCGVRC
jgi:hypothetical protein